MVTLTVLIKSHCQYIPVDMVFGINPVRGWALIGPQDPLLVVREDKLGTPSDDIKKTPQKPSVAAGAAKKKP